MIRFGGYLLATLLWSGAAFAQEYVVTDGPLSDADFYRLVSCAAPPGDTCQSEKIHWDKPTVRVTFAPIPPAYPVDLAKEMDRALDYAIAQINSAAPGLTVERVSKSATAEIEIYLQPIRAGDAISRTGRADLDGTPIGAAQVQVWWDWNRDLTEAVIVFAADIPLDQAGPIMLEELTQSMGLMTDIRNPYYTHVSVFSEDSNSVAKLGPQDREALRLHYSGR
ncbi:MAG: DUF2927 domain-containing protein [Pseudomonadota bacterium]